MAENVPMPLASVESAGNVAAPSVLVKCTVPAYPEATLLNASSAVTVKLSDVPAVAEAGALTAKCVAAAALTRIVFDVPVTDGVTESAAVMV